MGGSFSKSNACWLQTDKPVYHDGDYVQGVVCLNLLKPCTVADIECSLQAREATYWTETHDHGSGSDHWSTTETHGGSVTLLDVVQPLMGGNRQLAAGQYQWQIAFALPPGLPSSFKIGSAHDGGEVTYQVNIVFHTPGFFTSAIRSTHMLTVRQRMPVPPVIVDQSAELQLISCCCFNRGSVSARVTLDRDKCQPGEEVTVILELDNGRSKLPVDAIELSLKQEADIFERPGSYSGNHHRFHKELCTRKELGCPPFTALQGGTARRMQLRLPLKLQPSMRGALIRCDYYVKVKLNIGSFVKDVRLKVPLLVLAQQPAPTVEEPFFTEPPPFWSPSEVAPPQGIAVPSAPPLPPELLQPDAPFWARSVSHAGAGVQQTAAAAVAGAQAAAYPVV